MNLELIIKKIPAYVWENVNIIIKNEKWICNDWLLLMMDFHIPCYEISSRCKKEKWRLSLLKKSIGYIACK